MFRNDAAPTRSNIGKRLDMAEEALTSAEHLLAKMPADKNVATAVTNALGWIGDARLKMEKNKGKRARKGR